MNLNTILREAGPRGVWAFALALVVVATVVWAIAGVNPAEEAPKVIPGGGPDVPLHDAEHGRGADMPRGGDVGAAPATTVRPASFLADRGIKYTFSPSPNWSARAIGDEVEAVVMHVAAGSCPGMTSWFANPSSQVSAHFGICKNGEVIQYVELWASAWHAGICSRWTTVANRWCGSGINPNRRTIGIELELKPGERIEDYPAMLASAEIMAAWLLEQHDLEANTTDVIRHADIDQVNRSIDPDCCMNMATFRASVGAILEPPVPPVASIYATPPDYSAECWTDWVDERWGNRWNECSKAHVFPDGSFYLPETNTHYAENGVPK